MAKPINPTIENPTYILGEPRQEVVKELKPDGTKNPHAGRAYVVVDVFMDDGRTDKDGKAQIVRAERIQAPNSRRLGLILAAIAAGAPAAQTWIDKHNDAGRAVTSRVTVAQLSAQNAALLARLAALERKAS